MDYRGCAECWMERFQVWGSRLGKQIGHGCGCGCGYGWSVVPEYPNDNFCNNLSTQTCTLNILIWTIQVFSYKAFNQSETRYLHKTWRMPNLAVVVNHLFLCLNILSAFRAHGPSRLTGSIAVRFRYEMGDGMKNTLLNSPKPE